MRRPLGGLTLQRKRLKRLGLSQKLERWRGASSPLRHGGLCPLTETRSLQALGAAQSWTCGPAVREQAQGPAWGRWVHVPGLAMESGVSPFPVGSTPTITLTQDAPATLRASFSSPAPAHSALQWGARAPRRVRPLLVSPDSSVPLSCPPPPYPPSTRANAQAYAVKPLSPEKPAHSTTRSDFQE